MSPLIDIIGDKDFSIHYTPITIRSGFNNKFEFSWFNVPVTSDDSYPVKFVTYKAIYQIN